MKKYILFPAMLMAGILISATVAAQERPKEKKSEEIIIRKKGDKDQKMNIEINGDSVLVNGKPLSEFHDGDISILKNDELIDGGDLTFTPRNDFGTLNTFRDDEPHTFLGVVSEKVNGGVKINDVMDESAAKKSGLLKDDIITKVDDKTIATPDDLMKVIRLHKPGDEVKIYYLRDGKKKDVKVKLGETKNTNRVFMFKNINPGFNGNAFNFKMPKMPNTFSAPHNFYNFNWNTDKPKVGLKIEDTEDGSGVKVLNVQEGSPADKAGIKKDDVITEVNGEKINGVEDAMDQIGDANEGATINIKAMRNNSSMKFEVKIPKKLNQADL